MKLSAENPARQAKQRRALDSLQENGIQMAGKFDTRMRHVRKRRVRKRVVGTAERPRLSVFRSSKHIYAQVINDKEGHTLAAASSIEEECRSGTFESKTDETRAVGANIAKRAIKAGVSKIVFDRGGYLYHGHVKLLAESARENGLDF